MPVGHTHNIQDQRFATAATILAEATRLETPAAFQKHLQSRIWPLGDCVKESVEIFDASYDWKGWLAALEVNWHGHTSTKYTKLRNEDACHVFRFMKRKNLQIQLIQAPIETEFPEPPSPEDVIVLFKKIYLTSNIVVFLLSVSLHRDCFDCAAVPRK